MTRDEEIVLSLIEFRDNPKTGDLKWEPAAILSGSIAPYQYFISLFGLTVTLTLKKYLNPNIPRLEGPLGEGVEINTGAPMKTYQWAVSSMALGSTMYLKSIKAREAATEAITAILDRLEDFRKELTTTVGDQ